MSHEDLRRALASYVLGSLSPSERHEVDGHLQGCASCRDEIAANAGVPALLSRVSAHEAMTDELVPPSRLLPSLLAAVETDRARRRRQVVRWRGAGALLVAAAVVALALAVPTLRPAADPVDSLLVAQDDSLAAGSARVLARPWGTELRLVLTGLPQADRFEAYSVDRAGTRTLAASWGSTADGRADVPAATAVPVAELARVVVQTRQGVEVLVLTP